MGEVLAFLGKLYGKGEVKGRKGPGSPAPDPGALAWEPYRFCPHWTDSG